MSSMGRRIAGFCFGGNMADTEAKKCFDNGGPIETKVTFVPNGMYLVSDGPGHTELSCTPPITVKPQDQPVELIDPRLKG